MNLILCCLCGTGGEQEVERHQGWLCTIPEGECWGGQSHGGEGEARQGA